MNENKGYNILIKRDYKTENLVILKRKKINTIKFKSNNISKNNLFKNKKFVNDAILCKSKLFQNNNISFCIFKLMLLIILYSPILTFKVIILKKLNYASEITLTIRGIGEQRILNENNGFNSPPSEILVNGVKQNNTDFKVYGLTDPINNIILRWDYEIINCNFMFFNLSNITEIDLSKFNSQKITKMEQMFKRLHIINFY